MKPKTQVELFQPQFMANLGFFEKSKNMPFHAGLLPSLSSNYGIPTK